LPVRPDVLAALRANSVALYTPSGMGGLYGIAGYGESLAGGLRRFKVNRSDGKLIDIVVTETETMAENVFWRATVPTGFKPDLAPDSLLASCWTETADWELKRTPDAQFHYTKPERLGAEKSYRLYTGIDFLLNPVP